MLKVSIIIPIIRPEKAERCIKAIKENAGVPKEQYEIVTEVDESRIGCPKMVQLLTNKAKHNWVMFIGDDCIPEKDFLKEAIKAIDELPGKKDEEKWGVIGLNSNKNPWAHWMAHKYMRTYMDGEFFPLDYAHCWCDNELAEVANEMGRWEYAIKSKIEHKHPVFKTASWDEDYARVYADKVKKHDKLTFLRRKRARMVEQQGIKVGVCLPLTDEKVYAQFLFSYLTLEIPENYCLFMPKFTGAIDKIRNNLVEQALRKGCTHILMMDTDQIYHDSDTIMKLIAHELRSFLHLFTGDMRLLTQYY